MNQVNNFQIKKSTRAKPWAEIYIGFRLPKAAYDALQAEALDRGQSISAVMRLMIRDYLARRTNAPA